MLDILYIFKYKHNYNKYIKYISRHVVPKETWTILSDLKEWWESDPSREVVDWEAFSTWFQAVKHPLMSADSHAIYGKIFHDLKDYIGGTATEDVINSFIAREHGSKVADIALKVAEGDPKSKLDDIPNIIADYHYEIGSVHDDSFRASVSLVEIVEELTYGDGLEWRLNALNVSCGPLRKNDLVVVVARPETGKTSFLTSEVTHMASQMEKPVLWLNNEQASAAVWQRIYTSALGKPYTELKTDPLTYMGEYDKIVGRDKIILIDKADMSLTDVDRYIEQYDPGLIIVDQLWKLHGAEDAGTGAQIQGAIFMRARQWAKEQAPVIGTCQADTSAEGEKWIEKNQIYESKTAVAGEADVIVSIGMVHEPGYEKSRFIYVPKNKLPTPQDESLRHGRWECKMELETGRYTL